MPPSRWPTAGPSRRRVLSPLATLILLACPVVIALALRPTRGGQPAEGGSASAAEESAPTTEELAQTTMGVGAAPGERVARGRAAARLSRLPHSRRRGETTAPRGGEVTGVRVQPVPGRTEGVLLVIRTRGAVEVHDFTLTGPDRLVLDVRGARLHQTVTEPPNGGRGGGVVRVRYAQFKPDVVRVVLELDGARAYTIDRSPGVIRVSVGVD